MDSPRALPDEARNLPAALLDLRGLLAPVGFELFLRLLLRVSARPEVVEHRRLLNVAGVRHDNAGREPRVMRVRDEGVPHRSGCSGCRTPGTASSPGPSSPPSVSPPPSPFTQYLRAAPASTPPASSPANSQVRKKPNAAPLTLLEAEEFRRVPAERSRGASPHAVIPPGNRGAGPHRLRQVRRPASMRAMSAGSAGLGQGQTARLAPVQPVSSRL